jgi:hypothetical protein
MKQGLAIGPVCRKSQLSIGIRSAAQLIPFINKNSFGDALFDH